MCSRPGAQETYRTITIQWIQNTPPELIQGTSDQPLQINLNPEETRQILITDQYRDTDNPDNDLSWILTPISGSTDETIGTIEVDATNPRQLNIAASTQEPPHTILPPRTVSTPPPTNG